MLGAILKHGEREGGGVIIRGLIRGLLAAAEPNIPEHGAAQCQHSVSTTPHPALVITATLLRCSDGVRLKAWRCGRKQHAPRCHRPKRLVRADRGWDGAAIELHAHLRGPYTTMFEGQFQD